MYPAVSSTILSLPVTPISSSAGPLATRTKNANKSSVHGSHARAIVGGAVGACLGGVIVILLGLSLYRRQHKDKKKIPHMTAIGCPCEGLALEEKSVTPPHICGDFHTTIYSFICE